MKRSGIGQVQFVGSFPGALPPCRLPEVAFAGRSNVGKSSAINALLGNKKVARVSGTPGRTQAINLFEVGERLCLADLPGYGFARVPAAVQRRWKGMVERYLAEREALRLVVLLVDARHEAQAMDIQLVDALWEFDVPFVVVATKVDRVKKSKKLHTLKLLASGLGVSRDALHPISSTKREGLDAVWAAINEAVQG